MKAAQSAAHCFEIMVQNHNKLSGSREESLEIACETVLAAVAKDAAIILGPVCEQITRTTKKSKRMPYINVSQWIHERKTSDFDKYIVDAIKEFEKSGDGKRRCMGCCVLIRALGLSAKAETIEESLCNIVRSFDSKQASLFEMEVFNTAIFVCQVTAKCDSNLMKCVDKYAKWMREAHDIAAIAAGELLKVKDEGVSSLISLMRTDIPPSTDRCQSVWASIVGKPFEFPLKWIEFGLAIGRCDKERLHNEIASLSSEKGQFSSIITVALSAANQSIQRIARALFRFGIHGKETAAFDPSSLSQILEQSDELTDIAITFLSEMALANAKECVPQLFPLLQSEKPSARKNSLELLSRILKGEVEDNVRQTIASSLLPMVGDEAISVRVDIPKLFVSVKQAFIVPPLIKMLGDKSEKKRSTASSSINEIMKNTEDPAELLRIILDTALGLNNIAPDSPAAIDAVSPEERKRDCDRVLKLVEQWASTAKGKMFIDPNPVLNRLWADPKNGVIVSFIAKSTPLYNTNQLLAALLTRLRKGVDESVPESEVLFHRLAPLLVLRSQPVDFYSQREVIASNLFDLLFVTDDPEKQMRQTRADILARFSPNFTIPRVMEFGLFHKFSMALVCISGMYHKTTFPEVCDELEKKFYEVEDELFIPLCDAFFFSDRNRALDFAIKQNGTKRALLLINASFQKFEKSDAISFCKSGRIDRLLKMKFDDQEAPLAVDALFILTYKCCDMCLDIHWETLFEIASHYSDSKRPQCRMSALKLLSALIMNPSTDFHLEANFPRFQHIVQMAADDNDGNVRQLGQQLVNMMKPNGGKPLIEEI